MELAHTDVAVVLASAPNLGLTLRIEVFPLPSGLLGEPAELKRAVNAQRAQDRHFAEEPG